MPDLEEVEVDNSQILYKAHLLITPYITDQIISVDREELFMPVEQEELLLLYKVGIMIPMVAGFIVLALAAAVAITVAAADLPESLLGFMVLHIQEQQEVMEVKESEVQEALKHQ